MSTWYQATIAFQGADDKGLPKTLKENHLVDAVSWTDAEKRAYDLFASGKQDFRVDLKKARFSEVFITSEELELTWFKIRVQYITFDEKTQKEKKVSYYFLIDAKDLIEAYNELKDRLGKVQDYVISDVISTSIKEVHRYQTNLTDGAWLPPNTTVTVSFSPANPEEQDDDEDKEDN